MSTLSVPGANNHRDSTLSIPEATAYQPRKSDARRRASWWSPFDSTHVIDSEAYEFHESSANYEPTVWDYLCNCNCALGRPELKADAGKPPLAVVRNNTVKSTNDSLKSNKSSMKSSMKSSISSNNSEVWDPHAVSPKKKNKSKESIKSDEPPPASKKALAEAMGIPVKVIKSNSGPSLTMSKTTSTELSNGSPKKKTSSGGSPKKDPDQGYRGPSSPRQKL